jgi:hypothetical protein
LRSHRTLQISNKLLKKSNFFKADGMANDDNALAIAVITTACSMFCPPCPKPSRGAFRTPYFFLMKFLFLFREAALEA